MSKLLVGGYSGAKGDGSGITVLEDGEAVATIPAESPSWIAWHPELPVLYAVAEVDNGQVHAWRLAAEPMTAEPLGCGETGGSEPAHLAVDNTGRFLVTANYTGGSISVHRLGPDGSIGERTDLVQHEQHGDHPRQEAAHPHMVQPFEDGVLVIDLGADAIYQYRLSDAGQLTLVRVVDAPPGSGPRHLLQAGERYYVTAELSGELLVFQSDGKLAGRLPASRSAGHNQPSELAADDRHLYVANRGPNTISVFSLDGDLPRYVDEVSVGDWPRHIALDGTTLYVANERSNEVMAMRIDPETGIPALERAVEVPSPTIVLP
jgi:6-phosphogluconolactonase